MEASHILLRHFYEAQDVEGILKQGKLSFESIARKWSICSSSELGGWLGDLKNKKVDLTFMKTLESLSVGEVSPIIQTKFGYHLIKRES